MKQHYRTGPIDWRSFWLDILLVVIVAVLLYCVFSTASGAEVTEF